MDRTPTASLAPQLLTVAPHRLLFFVGAVNVLLAMAWWTLWLVDARWQVIGMPAGLPWAGWIHAFVMQYQLLPPFMFGFLMTTFPRWMGLPELSSWHYVPVGAGLLGGQLSVVGGMLAGQPAMVHIGVLMSLVGWGYGTAQLGRLVLAERAAKRGPTWHAWSCFTAMALGFLGLLAMAAWMHQGNPWLIFASIKIGTFGLLLPIYLTVAHRMFPFFASVVVKGYTPWRPMLLLGAMWVLLLAHLVIESFHVYTLLWPIDAVLAAGSAWVLWRWWPRDRAPGLLWVLFLGCLWMPLAFGLYGVQSLVYTMTGEFILGRGPAHAIYIGFFGSLLVAMVTRVTQGHSGRPLEMPAVGWFAFALLQLVTVARVWAEVAADVYAWQVIAAAGWLLAFLPWVVRSLRIYLTPRADGKPG